MGIHSVGGGRGGDLPPGKTMGNKKYTFFMKSGEEKTCGKVNPIGLNTLQTA